MNTKTEEKFEFQAEVSRLLDIVTNALYSNKEVFLRELISNAADACDRLRYEAISNPDLTKDDADFRINLQVDEKANTLTITDNGIGMSKKDLIDNLGTIARSGTAKIMEQIKKSKEAQNSTGDMNLIGQFGVGFYASFMVAKKVEVISRKAGSNTVWHWVSDGKSAYSLRPASKEEQDLLNGERGTAIILHMTGDGLDLILEDKIRMIVEKYSDHIDVPVYLGDSDTPLNEASALWTRSKSDVTDEQYSNFYKSISMGFDEPAITSHWKAEGVIEYNALLFVPTMRPFDLYDPKRSHGVRLYVKKVFITDQCEGLGYPWLRFLRGVIDSQDLPLNISREMLQSNPVVTKIRQGVTKRILSDLKKLSENETDKYNAFWEQFGAVLKEGLYDAYEFRNDILSLCRFYSTDNPDKRISLAEYKESMKDGQETIYYISGESVDAVKDAPQLEGFKARGINVLFMTDTIDEFWLQHNLQFEELSFKSVTRGGAEDFEDKDEDNKSDDKKAEEDKGEFEPLIKKLQTLLANDVLNVRLSKRLAESPVCFVVPDGQADMHMEKVLKIQQQYDAGTKRILELNPKHPVIKSLAAQGEQADEDSLWMLYDQACILQGEPPKNPAAFAKRLNKFMESAA